MPKSRTEAGGRGARRNGAGAQNARRGGQVTRLTRKTFRCWRPVSPIWPGISPTCASSVPVVVAINRFATDTAAELGFVESAVAREFASRRSYARSLGARERRRRSARPCRRRRS